MKLCRAQVAVLAAGLLACASQPPPMPATFENAGARLAFTLDLPVGRRPFPAVVGGVSFMVIMSGPVCSGRARDVKALVAAGKPFEWREYPGLDHPLSSAIWDDVGRWVSRFDGRLRPGGVRAP